MNANECISRFATSVMPGLVSAPVTVRKAIQDPYAASVGVSIGPLAALYGIGSALLKIDFEEADADAILVDIQPRIASVSEALA